MRRRRLLSVLVMAVVAVAGVIAQRPGPVEAEDAQTTSIFQKKTQELVQTTDTTVLRLVMNARENTAAPLEVVNTDGDVVFKLLPDGSAQFGIGTVYLSPTEGIQATSITTSSMTTTSSTSDQGTFERLTVGALTVLGESILGAARATTLQAGATTLGQTTVASLSSGPLSAGTSTLGNTTVNSLSTTGSLNAGASTLGNTTVNSLSTTGSLNAGVSTLGNTTVNQLTSSGAVIGASADFDSATIDTLTCTGCVDTVDILNGTVNVADIGTDAVDSDEIAADAVRSVEIANDAVGSAEIATDAVGSTEISNNAVGAAEIATDAVTNAEIAEAAVGTDEIGTAAVGADEIGTAAVGADEIGTAAVGADEIGTAAVGADEIANGTVGSDEIGTSGVGTDEIGTDAVTGSEIATGAVGASEITTDAVGGDEIAEAAVGTGEVADGSILAVDLGDSQCDDGELLKWDEDTSGWGCATDANLSGVDTSDFVTRAGTQVITGTKTFTSLIKTTPFVQVATLDGTPAFYGPFTGSLTPLVGCTPAVSGPQGCAYVVFTPTSDQDAGDPLPELHCIPTQVGGTALNELRTIVLSFAGDGKVIDQSGCPSGYAGASLGNGNLTHGAGDNLVLSLQSGLWVETGINVPVAVELPPGAPVAYGADGSLSGPFTTQTLTVVGSTSQPLECIEDAAVGTVLVAGFTNAGSIGGSSCESGYALVQTPIDSSHAAGDVVVFVREAGGDWIAFPTS